MIRTLKLISIMTIFLLLCSCSSNRETFNEQEVNQLKAQIQQLNIQIENLDNKLTGYNTLIEDIKNVYSNEKIEDIFTYMENYIFIKSRKENHEYWTLYVYDLTTGDKSKVTSGTEHDSIKKVSENEVVILNEGRWSEIPSARTFPYIKRYIKEDNKEDFKKVIEDYFLSVEDSVIIGCGKKTTLSNIEFEDDNIILKFAPQKSSASVGDLGEYFARVADVPLTTTFYNNESDSLILRFSNTKLNDTIKEVFYPENIYFKSVSFKTYNDYCECIIELTDEGKEYHIDQAWWKGKIKVDDGNGVIEKEYDLPKAVIKFR